MMVAIIFSTRPICLGPGSGIWIDSLSSLWLVIFPCRWPCGAYRTCLWAPPLARAPGPPTTPPSTDPRSLICNGSSSSASCSARSPVSLHRENSEPAESVERRPGCFSSVDSIRGAEWSSLCWVVEVKARRGIDTEERGFEEGMVPVVRG